MIVVIARDKTVLNRKGRMPILPEDQRRELVGSLRVVDKVILGHAHLDLLGILREVKPDIVSVGYDQRQIKASVEKLLREQDLHIRVVQIPKFGPNGLNSSTGIRQRVARGLTNRSRRRRVPGC